MTAPVLLTYGDQTMCISAWARERGIHAVTLTNRLRRGWPLAEALNQPIGVLRPGVRRAKPPRSVQPEAQPTEPPAPRPVGLRVTPRTLLTRGGVTRSVHKWAAMCGVSCWRLVLRLANGWDVERALTPPKKQP